MPKVLKGEKDFIQDWFRREKKIFVAGTDTEVGKTWISAELIKGFLSAAPVDPKILYLKPVESGAGTKEGADSQWMKKKFSRSGGRVRIHKVRSLAAPVSPHLAARWEGTVLELAPTLGECRRVLAGEEFAVVEGAGGILTPLNEKHSMLDFAAGLGLPVVLVARAELGTISHTLLTCAALQKAGLRVNAVLLNRAKAKKISKVMSLKAGKLERQIQVENRDFLAKKLGVPVFLAG